MTTHIVKAVHTRQLLDQILETPQLVTVIQSLNSQVLRKLIQHIGLEDSSAIISLTTTEQLKQVFDEDLWHNTKAGREEKFDADRFGTWLDVMMELGTSFAVQKFTELDEDFLTYALSQHLLVIDIEQMAMEISAKGRHSQADDLLEKALESSLCHEFEEFRVFSKSHESWDSLIAILSTLDSEDHTFLHKLLERCCDLSAEYIEDNGGLYDVLTSSKMLESDVSFEREQRREREGYVPPLTAKSFLSLIQETELGTLLQGSQPDYITKAHFKAYVARTKTQPNKTAAETASADQTEKFIHFLQEQNVLEKTAAGSLLLETSAGASQQKAPLIRAALAELKDNDAVLHQQRMAELNYLANVLISGCNYEGRKFRPYEAADAVLATCNLGLETVCRAEPSKEQQIKNDVIQLFQVGYKILHTQVVQKTRKKLKELLTHAAQNQKDEWIQKQLTNALKEEYMEQLEALELIAEPARIHRMRLLTDELPALAQTQKEPLFISSWTQILEAQDLANRF